MLANEQHRDRHAQDHAEGEKIAKQMTIGHGALIMMVTPVMANRLAGSVG